MALPCACRAVDGAPDVLKRVAARYPTLRHIFADGGYAGPRLRAALKEIGHWTIQIVKRSDTAKGFEVFSLRHEQDRQVVEAGRIGRMRLAQGLPGDLHHLPGKRLGLVMAARDSRQRGQVA